MFDPLDKLTGILYNKYTAIEAAGTVEDGKQLGVQDNQNQVGFTMYLDAEYDFDSITVSIHNNCT